MPARQVCNEIQSILDDMESCMDNGTSVIHQSVSVKDSAYRVGYYAAIRDARRMLALSPVIAACMYQHEGS